MRTRLAPAPLVLTTLLVLSSPLTGQSVGPISAPAFLVDEAQEAPPRVIPRRLAAPLARLSAAAVGARDQLAALESWNAAGRRPPKNGFRRALPFPRTVHLSPTAGALDGGVASRDGDTVVWGTRVEVDGAYRLRLHLTGVELPPAARLWVWSDAETRGPFGADLIGPEGDLWTPSVAGGAIWIEVAVPAADLAARSYGFTVADVIEIVGGALAPRLQKPLPGDWSCMEDGTCISSSRFASIAAFRHAIASLEFVSGNDGFFCTGGLLNDAASDLKPYLLTANHCVSTAPIAASVEAVWDDYDAGCFSLSPDRSKLRTSEGATLLATALTSDVSLLLLRSVPAGRTFLGWTASPATALQGVTLYSLSHPYAQPQAYNESSALSVARKSCGADGDSRPLDDPTRFIHSIPTFGAVFAGSSGAPVVRADGRVVGQHYGLCGEDPEDPCFAGNAIDQVDGAFSASFPLLAPYLAPAAPPGPCVPGDTTLCIDAAPGDRRFRVEATFQLKGSAPAPAHAISLASLGVDAGGVFWFFDPTNPELLVKVLDGCALGGHYWVFFSAGTNVGLAVTVTDAVTGNQRTYTNPVGTAAPPVQDTAALPCN